jgi:hypothetical protein
MAEGAMVVEVYGGLQEGVGNHDGERKEMGIFDTN